MHITFSTPRDWGDALRQAAVLWGVEAEYWDIWGKHHVVDETVLVAILKTLGVPCGTVDELSQAIEARLREAWGVVAPATVVVFEDEVRVSVSVPPGLGAMEAVLRLESGVEERLSFDLGALETTGTAEFGGQHFERKTLEFTACPLNRSV